MKYGTALAFALALALLATGCGSRGASGLPAAPNAASSAARSPQVIQRNDGSHWVTVASYPTVEGINQNALLSTAAGVSVPTDDVGANPVSYSLLTIAANGGVSSTAAFNCANLNYQNAAPNLIAVADVAVSSGGTYFYAGAASHSTGGPDAVGIGNARSGTMNCYYLGNGTDQFITALAPDADGNVWGVASDYYWRLTPSGVLTPYAYASNSGYGVGLTLGPDGKMWMTQSNGSLYRFSPKNGQLLNTYNYAPACVVLKGIKTIAGSLWAGCVYPNGGVMKISAAGAGTFYPVNPANGSTSVAQCAHGITQGPDGNPWFVAGNGIATVVPSTGKVTVFAGEASFYDLISIVTGPDRNLWVSDGSGGTIDVFVRNPLTVTPSAVSLAVGGKQQLTAAENVKTSWTATSANPAIATVAKANTPGTFIVKAVATGTTTVTVADAHQNYVTVNVSVQ